MATFTGQRATSDISAFRKHYDLSRRILELEPEYQPFMVFLNNIYNGGRSIATKTEKFRWSEYELDDRLDAVNHSGGYTSSDTSIVVDTGDLFYEEALVKVPSTGEVMRVNPSGVSTNTLTVTRGYGGTTAAALPDNTVLLIIGGAREEGDRSKAARTREPVEVYNWTQIFKTWVEESGTELSSEDDTLPHDWTFQQHARMIEHQKDKELTFWFGAPGDQAGVTKHVRTTGGVEHYANQNTFDAGGTLTETEFETFLRPALRYGSRSSKVLFVSRLIASVLNNFSQGKLQTTVGDTMYGVAISRWISAHGQIKIVPHDLFDENGYSDRAFLVDFEGDKVAYRYLAGQNVPGGSRDTHINENVQENDRDGRKDEILSECGLKFALPKAHGVLTGVTG